MPVYEIEANGKVYEVDAPDPQTAMSALGGFAVPEAPAGRPDRARITEAAPPPAIANPATTQSRSQQLIEASMAEPDPVRAKALMDQASYAAVQDGETPAGIAFNPATGRMEDLSSPISPYTSQGSGAAAQIGAMQGLSMGGADEAVGGLNAMGAALGPGTMGQRYAWGNAVADAQMAQSRQAHPYIMAGSEIAGGAASGIAATAGIAPATTLAGRFAQAAGIGGASGAVYSGLSTEGGAVERGTAAALGGLIGAGVGAASVPVEIGLRRAGDAVWGLAQNLSGKVKTERVEAALAQALAGSKQAPAQITDDLTRAAQEGQGVYTLADALGTAGQRELSGASRLGGRAKVIATEALDQRQAGQGERIGAALADALGIKDTAAAREAAMRQARGQTAEAAYDAARKGAQAVDVRGALATIDDRIGPMQGSGISGDGIDAKLAGYRSRLAADNPAAASPRGGAGLASDGYDATPLSVELSDFDRVLGVKQALQDDIGAAVRAGRNNEARELGKIVSELDQALEAASDGYRAANDGFRKASREIDQIDAGANATRPGRRAADTVAEYRPLTDAEKQAYRAGYGDRLLGRLENAAEGVNKARPFTSQKSSQELAALAAEPETLARVLARENTMFDTRRITLGGSQTADNLADMQGVGGLTRKAANAIRSPLNAVADAADWVARMSGGQNDATRAALVEALLSTGDDAAANIARAVARGEKLNSDQALALRTILYLQGGGVAQAAR